MNSKSSPNSEDSDVLDGEPADQKPLEEGTDYYVEDGLFVFTADFLLRRGYCCESGCRHCPYTRDD